MMAFENIQKREPRELLTQVDPKRRKVEFANGMTLQMASSQSPKELQGNGEFSSAIYVRFATFALDELDKDDAQLGIILDQLSASPKSSSRITPTNFEILLDILSNSISRIDNSKGAKLIHAIINFEKWWELPESTVEKYVFFIRILCSSIPKWWQDVSMVLVSSLNLPLKRTKYHHQMLAYFLKVIPSSMGVIDSYLSRFFPNKNDTCENIVNYISNLLKILSYCKELRFQVWSLLIEKIISIDVELQNELDELDDDIDDIDDDDDDEDDDIEQKLDADIGIDTDEKNREEVADNSDLELSSDEEDGDNNEDNELEDIEEYVIESSQSIKELSQKLDSILVLVSHCIEDTVTPESLDNGDGIVLFNTLMTLFKTHILPTYYTRSIQYIIFHISQLQPELMDAFLVTLIEISFSPSENAERRIKSLQYLGSYIARARCLTRVQIIFVASYLTSWLNRYMLEREVEVDEPGGMDRFKHFYAAFQALCYIFCFRREMFRDSDGKWECDLDKFFQRTIISKFNPLKYCNENVMLMFARITQHEDIAYCFSIIEKNNNERLRGIMGKVDDGLKRENSKTGLSSAGATAVSTWSLATRQQFIDLQSYFPFDPLFLKKYKDMMREYYIEWGEVSGEYESDESDE